MLKKKYRLTSNKDFKTLYSKGRKIRGEFGMLIILKSPEAIAPHPPKFGYVVNKKVGNAVARHLHTRRLRHISYEFIKLNEAALSRCNFSYIAFKNATKYASLEKELLSQLESGLKHLKS